jgi:hypothetical protein
MQQTIQSADGRELHISINPTLAGLDRLLHHCESDAARLPPPSAEDERYQALARARAVVARTRLAWV